MWLSIFLPEQDTICQHKSLYLLIGLTFMGLSICLLVTGIRTIVRWARSGRSEAKKILVSKTNVVLLFVWIASVLGEVPNFYVITQRTHVKQSSSDLRSMGISIERYAMDHHEVYPVAESMEELARILEPRYIAKLPLKDDWGRPFRYVVRNFEKGGAKEYLILSTGKDGLPEVADPWSYPIGSSNAFDSDIVFSGGSFLRFHEGHAC